MKVLLVHYNPSAGGGAESAVADQKRALEGLGHEVHVEFTNPERAWARWHPDIVHFHTIHIGLGLHLLAWAQQKHIPHCLSLHDYWPFCGDRMLMREGARPGDADAPCSAVDGVCDGACTHRPTDARVKALVNGSPTVTFSPYGAEIFERHGVRISEVIPHGIDTEAFRPAATMPAEPRIVTMSAWASYNTKGMHVLRKALEQLRLRATCITGIDRKHVPEKLREGNIFVFPSTYQETWGLCLTEAMSTGLACIASGVAGTKAQVQHGVNGLLVPPRDADALADALRLLVEDRGLRERLGKAARAWATEHATLERMGRDYEAFYGRLIGGAYGA